MADDCSDLCNFCPFDDSAIKHPLTSQSIILIQDDLGSLHAEKSDPSTTQNIPVTPRSESSSSAASNTAVSMRPGPLLRSLNLSGSRSSRGLFGSRYHLIFLFIEVVSSSGDFSKIHFLTSVFENVTNITRFHCKLSLIDEFFQKDTARKLLQKRPGMDKESDGSGWIPLHYAAKLGDALMVNLLLSYDFSTGYRKDNMGNMAIHIAAQQGWKNTSSVILS